jgi:SAM-dependent methyltransferase
MQVDAVLSVATLRWRPDHAVVFDHVAAALRPGGQFVAEAGGRGNIADFRRALSEIGADDGGAHWNFATVPDTNRSSIRSRSGWPNRWWTTSACRSVRSGTDPPAEGR